MATKTYIPVCLVVSVIFIAVLSVLPAKAFGEEVLQETKLSLYFHHLQQGHPNATSLPLVGLPGQLWGFTQFGTIFVTDNLMTEGPDQTSPTVGRVQGLSVTTSLDGLNGYISVSLVFTNQAYNGSHIHVQGNSNQFKAIREYGITSGSGKFRNAQGYVTMETIHYDPSAFYALIRINATVSHE